MTESRISVGIWADLCKSVTYCQWVDNVEGSVYQATITCEEEPDYGERFYIGLAEPKFKKRFANHKSSFSNERYEKETELSKEIWRLKRKSRSPKITWKTIRQCPPFNRANLKCSLCLNEKLEIATFPEPDKLLNSRNELISKCRHVNKFTLKTHDKKKDARFKRLAPNNNGITRELKTLQCNLNVNFNFKFNWWSGNTVKLLVLKKKSYCFIQW